MSDKIDSALMQAFVDGAFGLSTAYENVPFEPVVGAPWAQLFILPAQPTANTLGAGGQDLIEGLFQINLNYPIGDGAGLAKQKANEIREYFYAGRVFTYAAQDVFISSAGRGISQNIDSYYQIILTINFQSRVTRP